MGFGGGGGMAICCFFLMLSLILTLLSLVNVSLSFSRAIAFSPTHLL
jgi:hypothetical protein